MPKRLRQRIARLLKCCHLIRKRQSPEKTIKPIEKIEPVEQHVAGNQEHPATHAKTDSILDSVVDDARGPDDSCAKSTEVEATPAAKPWPLPNRTLSADHHGHGRSRSSLHRVYSQMFSRSVPALSLQDSSADQGRDNTSHSTLCDDDAPASESSERTEVDQAYSPSQESKLMPQTPDRSEDVDFTTHYRAPVVEEHVHRQVHTIYHPRRTRSIHFHEHFFHIQPIIMTSTEKTTYVAGNLQSAALSQISVD